MTITPEAVTHLSDAAFLNRVVYGGEHLLQPEFLDDYDPLRDPAKVDSREALNVYDAYDDYLAGFGWTVLSSEDLGFEPSEISASDLTDGLDRNFTYEGGLWRNNYQRFEDGTEVAFTDAAAIAQVVVRDGTLHMVFRGTDADLGSDGEAGTAAGQARYYRQLKPLIDQVHEYASDPANGVIEVVVSGQSLGGQMADIFALYDGARFEALPGVELQVVALASAGIEPGLFALMPGFDESRVQIADDGTVSFETPDWYLQYAHAEDVVYFPDRYDAATHAAEDPEQAPVTTAATTALRDHIHFEGNLIEVMAPQIPQYALSADFETNFLAQHYPSFYELSGQGLAAAAEGADLATYDAFVVLYGLDPNLAGVTGTNNVNGWGLPVDDTVDLSAEPILGSADVFVFALSGDDRVTTGEGHDLLAGGDGSDTLDGGAGNDRYVGGADADIFVITKDQATDVIADYQDEIDRIDLSGNNNFKKWGEVKKNATDTAEGVEISRNGQTILIEDAERADLDKGDFIF